MTRHAHGSSGQTSRRAFLHRSAVGLAGLAAAGLTPTSSRATEGPKWTMRLSCSSINFRSLPIEQACQRIAALGFEAIDIWGAYTGCPHLDEALNRLGPDGLNELLAKSNLKLYAFSVYVGGYAKYAELLGKAGGGVAVRGSTGPCEPHELVPRMKAFLESLKPEAELAEKFNSYLAIENHGHALLDTLDSMKAMVDLNTNPRIGIALAPYHVQGLNQSVEEAIRICGGQLLFFYAWQRAGDAQQLPGIGPADCVPWIKALAKIGYRWYVNPFMHHEPPPDDMSALMAKSVEYLKQCYARAVA